RDRRPRRRFVRRFVERHRGPADDDDRALSRHHHRLDVHVVDELDDDHDGAGTRGDGAADRRHHGPVDAAPAHVEHDERLDRAVPVRAAAERVDDDRARAADVVDRAAGNHHDHGPPDDHLDHRPPDDDRAARHHDDAAHDLRLSRRADASSRSSHVARRLLARVQRWITRFGGAPVGLVVVGALVSRLPGFVHQLFDPDEAAIATMGMVVARGGTLYRDVADRKPPLAPFLYAASFWLTGSRDLRPLHVFAALEIAAAALICASEVRRRAGAHAAWWAAGLLVTGAVALNATDAQAANFSHLALLPACAAIVAARRGTRGGAVLGGVMLGLAVLTRQTWVIGIVPAAYAAWWHGGRRAGRAVVLVTTAALTVTSVAVTVPFSSFFRWTFTDNGSLLFDLAHSQSVGARAAQAIAVFLAGHVVLCWLVARRGWRRDELDLWLWLATGLVAVAAGFRFFGHYWLQVLPPMCLLAAP